MALLLYELCRIKILPHSFTSDESHERGTWLQAVPCKSTRPHQTKLPSHLPEHDLLCHRLHQTNHVVGLRSKPGFVEQPFWLLLRALFRVTLPHLMAAVPAKLQTTPMHYGPSPRDAGYFRSASAYGGSL